MKAILTAAAIAAGLTATAQAQVPQGVYVGTFTANYFDLFQQKPTKSKENVMVVVESSSGGIILESGTIIGGDGLAGLNHALYINDSASAVGSVSLHFGNGYTKAKGVVTGGVMTMSGPKSVEGKLSLSKVPGSEPDDPIIITSK